jgi:fatty acid desaturase
MEIAMHQQVELQITESVNLSRPSGCDPRMLMAERLPQWLQPFLTWLTAKPAAGETTKAATGVSYVRSAVLWTIMGCLLSVTAIVYSGFDHLVFWLLLPAGLIATTCGLGLFQVVVFHHCSHGTVFKNRIWNRRVGKLISAILLFKHFDLYQRGHMVHHSANKLFTVEDEFTDFVMETCGLAPSLDKRELWRRILLDLVSPRFHGQFLWRRVRVSLMSHDGFYASLLGFGWWTGLLAPVVVAWIIPVSILLQIATVFRILCEHRFPAAEVIERRGKEFVCLATAAVFPGAQPPARSAATARGFASWMMWWMNMLTVQLFVRLFVLVGDAPCHDFHHRRPAAKRWTDYIHARQADVDAGCPGFPVNYIETWGLFRAIDENLESMSNTAPASISRAGTVNALAHQH